MSPIKREFLVTIRRVTFETVCVPVDAESAEQAKEIASERADDYDGSYEVEDEVLNVEEVRQ